MRKIYLLIILVWCSFGLSAQNCLSLGCADSYTITTDGSQPDQSSGPEWGCYYGYPRKETIWQYFYSDAGGNYTQSFASAADLDWQVYDMGTSFSALNCPISPSSLTLVGCDISYNPGGPTGPGIESTVTTTAGHYYAVALILWEPLTLTFTFGTPQLSGSNLTSANCLTVLPVTLISFTASPAGNNVLLSWNVGEEKNVSRYELQGSQDGQNFLAIGNRSATGQHNYHFLYSGGLSAGTNYYRLKTIDTDGKIAFSPIIKLQSASTTVLKITTNPVGNLINLTGLQGRGEVRVIDMTGKIILTKKVTQQTMSVDAGSVRPGLYILQYEGGNTTELVKFLKL